MIDGKYEYFAFISYKSQDKKWAKWLQRKLESYSLPTALRKEKPTLPDKIRPVFRDVTDLSGGKLEKEIEKNLNKSKYLIVICSPRSAQSPWVSKEVQHFINQGREGCIIPFIIGGTPYAANPENECFPEGLRQLTGENEILGINIKEMGREAAVIKVIARMFDLRFGALWQRYERAKRKKRRILGIVVAFIVLFLAAISIALYSQNSMIKSEISKSISLEIDRNLNDLNYSESLNKTLYAIERGYVSAPEWEKSVRRLCNNPYFVQTVFLPQIDKPIIINTLYINEDSIFVNARGRNNYLYTDNKFTKIGGLSNMCRVDDINTTADKFIFRDDDSSHKPTMQYGKNQIGLPDYSSIFFINDTVFIGEKRDYNLVNIELIVFTISGKRVCSTKLPKNYNVPTARLKKYDNHNFYVHAQEQVLRVGYNESLKRIDTLEIIRHNSPIDKFSISNNGNNIAFSNEKTLHFRRIGAKNDSISFEDPIIDFKFSESENILDIITKAQLIRLDINAKKILSHQKIDCREHRKIIFSDKNNITISDLNNIQTYTKNNLYHRINKMHYVPSDYKFAACSKYNPLVALKSSGDNSIVIFNYQNNTTIFKKRFTSSDGINVKFINKNKVAIINGNEIDLYSLNEDKISKRLLTKRLYSPIIDCIVSRNILIVATRDSLHNISISDNKIICKVFRPNTVCLGLLSYKRGYATILRISQEGDIYYLNDLSSLKEQIFFQSNLKNFDYSYNRNSFIAKSNNVFESNLTVIGKLGSKWNLDVTNIPHSDDDDFHFINDEQIVGLKSDNNTIVIYDRDKNILEEFKLDESHSVEKILYIENDNLWLYDNNMGIVSLHLPNTKSIISEISRVKNDR